MLPARTIGPLGPACVEGPEDAAAAEVETLRLVEERVTIGKREVELGGVRVRLRTEAEEAIARVALRAERTEVERVPIGRVVESAPPIREEDGMTIIPVLEEVLVVEKRLVLKEELRVRRVAETREHEETVLLRRQRAEVERLGPDEPATSAMPSLSNAGDRP